ncbi:MAG: hypothetical protein ACT4OJ_08795 [Bacteroidota bacterium]
MISTNANKGSLKEIREREKKEKELRIKEQCEKIAIERCGSEDDLVKLSNAHKGLWFLPTLTEDEQIEKLLILKPIDRHILSFASTKITDDGLYAFLEAAMRECVIEKIGEKVISDMVMLDDDEYFISAANSFQKVMDGKKTALVKR